LKNQSAPWGDVLFYENPGDEVYFGEVYRESLQEAWLPEVSAEWFRVGKSRRGWRPTKRGLIGPNLSASEEQIRAYFHSCTEFWKSLPDYIPNDPPCDIRWGKDYWWQQKIDYGVQCSYYDLFMRFCLKCMIETGCPCPSMYVIECAPLQILNAQPGSEHPISFTGNCGPVSLLSGNGSFSEGVWIAGDGPWQGNLVFSDGAGGHGCVHASVASVEMTCDPENPVTIVPSQILSLSVIGGTPPYTWSSGVGGTLFDDPTTETPTNDLRAIDCLPGDEGFWYVNDSKGLQVSCPMEAISGGGSWVYVGLYAAYREGDQCGVPIYPSEKTIIVDTWKFVLPTWGGRCSYGGTVWWDPDAPATPPCNPRACAGYSCSLTCALCPPCEKDEYGVCQPCTFDGQAMYDYFMLYEWVC
jgi:hypothetical protein